MYLVARVLKWVGRIDWNNRTDFQTDLVFLLGQLKEKEEKALPSHFLIFLLASCTNGTFGFARHTSQRFAKPKEPFFCHRTDNIDDINSLENMRS